MDSGSCRSNVSLTGEEEVVSLVPFHRNDLYAAEPTAEVDPAIYLKWKTAKEAADAWGKEAARLRAELEQQIGEAHAGMVDGVKVVTFRPVSKWAESRLVRDYPELAEQYRRTEERVFFDLDRFRQVHPDIAEKYQSRSFCLVAE